MWEMPVQTDVTVTHNRPDLIYTDKTSNKTYLIDITVPSDYNIGAKEIEKLSKYHLLKTEISRLWNTQTAVIPIVVVVTGIVAKSIKKYIDQLDASINIHILQKQAAIHSSIILSKVLGDTVFVRTVEAQHSHTDTQTPDTQNTHPSPSTQAGPAIQEQNTQQSSNTEHSSSSQPRRGRRRIRTTQTNTSTT
ncbi:hypothetical protein B5X24_HaOG211751 [Helicoverpa armigera]|uniref:Uncharacterized protein n=1 Tax=Helicoverpa armigera TaxID=29058 RepID=A0A2W1BG72_HELAM|nr:hypothetical protein B5X24_HaOG211751 [Helicoverpa armigera]